MTPEIISDQIDAVFEDIFPDAVKVGMLSSGKVMETVAAKLAEYKPQHIVIDPVMYAKNGSPLMHEDAVSALIAAIVPAATVLTPNIPEAERITGMEIRLVRRLWHWVQDPPWLREVIISEMPLMSSLMAPSSMYIRQRG